MDFAGLSDERAARSIAGHRSSGRGRRARSITVRPGSVNVRQSGAVSPLTASRPAADVEYPGPETADQRQAEYFLRLLTQSRHIIDHRIGEYQKAIAVAEAEGDAEGACGFRRMARIEEQDGRTVDGMIEKLHRRFPLRASGEVPPLPRKARLVVR